MKSNDFVKKKKNSLFIIVSVTQMFSNGICQTITEDTSSSCLCCLDFLFILLCPWPPEITNTELAFIFLDLCLLFLSEMFWSFKSSYMVLSSVLCSTEFDPWGNGSRDPEDEDKSLLCVMDPAEPPSQTPVSWILLKAEPGLSLRRAFFWSSSLVSVLRGRLLLDLLLFFLFRAAAIIRNLTGPLCAW